MKKLYLFLALILMAGSISAQRTRCVTFGFTGGKTESGFDVRKE